MAFLTQVAARLDTIRELFAFLWQQKLWWMIPMMVVLLLFGLLFIVAQGTAMAPFIYALF